MVGLVLHVVLVVAGLAAALLTQVARGAEVGRVCVDDVPMLPAEPIAKAGDVWLLRVREQVRSGSGLGVAYLSTYANCLFAPIIKSIPLTMVYSAAEFTVEVSSSGASGSGVGSNGPSFNWRLDNVN